MSGGSGHAFDDIVHFLYLQISDFIPIFAVG